MKFFLRLFFYFCEFFRSFFFFFFFNDTATTEIYTLSLHDALPIHGAVALGIGRTDYPTAWGPARSEEHPSELQSRGHLVCRLLLEKKKISELYPCPELSKTKTVPAHTAPSNI